MTTDPNQKAREFAEQVIHAADAALSQYGSPASLCYQAEELRALALLALQADNTPWEELWAEYRSTIVPHLPEQPGAYMPGRLRLWVKLGLVELTPNKRRYQIVNRGIRTLEQFKAWVRNHRQRE